ncbi:MAG: DUF4212 domain-containing protein [Marinilabiliaceae bacterium]|nr:DUF4212 domain-containing protein [Marinilabiliaceae bacterium]
MNQEENYHISFFRPTTNRALTNRNMVLWLIGIWAVAIFGFHFLMRVIEKPTPEPQLTAFNAVWSSVKTNQANPDEVKQFALSALHVAGKVFIKPDYRAALDNGFTWATFQLADSAQRAALSKALLHFEKISAEAKTINDDDYLNAKQELGALIQPLLGLQPGHVLTKIAPLELQSSDIDQFTEANKALVETCMPLYSIHNQSVLTDTRFLGFPFHYFYTAVFLLLLFIGLCWVYCYKVDQYNKKMGIAE